MDKQIGGSGSAGSELFIVDNSDQDWKALQYVRDWSGLPRSIDIATGFCEIGALLGLDGEWQKVDHIRILKGEEVSQRTKKAFAEGPAGQQPRGREGEKRLSRRRARHRRGDPLTQDRVPRLPQEEIPRQGIHHARPCRGRRCLLARRFIELPPRRRRRPGGPCHRVHGSLRAPLDHRG